ncbi:FhaA domain-containing protein [Aquipuribacter nitratireducens]|uniref:FhaA domain-containing protein n=1 Tax=Aquipuribacter nitratireducens TaxID=650104 RepID=A0ABW0GMU0_9MICO
MGLLDKFERGVERAVNGVFARTFKSKVQPVEIASALRRELDDRAAVLGRGRTLVPNAFTVTLSGEDHDRLAEWEDALADELAASLMEHADKQRYAFVGPVTVVLDRADDLEVGLFDVSSQTVKGAVAPATSRTATGGRPVIEVDGRAYVLTGPVTTIGRGSDADIVLDDSGVSRRHCELRVDTGPGRTVLSVLDLGSTNGTLLLPAGSPPGSEQPVGHQALQVGDCVLVGHSRVVVRDAG